MKITIHKDWWSYRNEGYVGYFVMFMMPLSLILFISSFFYPFTQTRWGYTNPELEISFLFLLSTMVFMNLIRINRINKKLNENE